MKVLIVHAHNKPQSFSAAMKDLAVKELCVFRRSWTAIPGEAGHSFQSKLDSRRVATRGF